MEYKTRALSYLGAGLLALGYLAAPEITYAQQRNSVVIYITPNSAGTGVNGKNTCLTCGIPRKRANLERELLELRNKTRKAPVQIQIRKR